MYTGNQWQSLFLPVVAKSVGLTDDKVIIHQYYLGGGFGRRLAGDYIIPAALTVKAIGNAIFNAVGARVRDLPITPMAVKALI